jgi:DNA-directed RNA polymerase subunit beta
MAKLIPDRGAWMEFETRKSDYIIVKFNRRRTMPVTVLLRALAAVDDGTGGELLGTSTDEELLDYFADADSNPRHPYIETTIRQEPRWELRDGRNLAEEALVEFYRRMRPGDPATLDNAREYLEQQIFDPRRYDLQRVGRYKLNQRLRLNRSLDHRTITRDDLMSLVERMIRINNGTEDADDIDHLGNRRVKTVGELVQNKLRIGLRRMERVVLERMSIRESESLTPVNLINIRPVVAAIREFYGSSQLSQFMEQTNPLSELTHKRTLSALGPGGLRRERAGFDVRDVHYSHYGRICPIETPEGPNIGLIGRLATYARVNPLGFVETPYRRVIHSVRPIVEELVGHTLKEDVVEPGTGEVVVQAGTTVSQELADRIAALELEDELPVVPKVGDEITYLSADREEHFTIAQGSAELDQNRHFARSRVSSRRAHGVLLAPPDRIDYMDVAPCQIVGVSASLIPFLEHDDANRALMGSNMQRQAVPLIRPEAPIVSTGMEWQAARDSGQVVQAREDGEVVTATGNSVVTRSAGGVQRYPLKKYQRSNQSTCIDQRPIVLKGQRVSAGEILADSSSTQHGDLALGHNVVCAFLSWEGGNFEDAILISERLVRDDRFSSIHIEKHEIQARDTKLGPEEITRDIPNAGEDALRDLGEDGIVRIGAEVGPLDILVGKITPKGEKELSPEEKLLRAIFGEKAREVKDSSLKLPHGDSGKVVDVKVFDRQEHQDLPAGVEKMVRVSVAQLRRIKEGDKMAGRHGNKGVISKVVPVEDMPFLADGTPIDVILNPLGVPGRMNIGQVLETHLGWAAHRLGFRAITPVFDGAKEEQVEAELARAWLIDRAWKEVTERAWAWLKSQSYPIETLEDDDEARRLYLVAWLSEYDYDVDRLIQERVYARRAALRQWLAEGGLDADAVLNLPGESDVIVRQASPKDAAVLESDLRAIAVCARIWLEDRGHDVSDLGDGAAVRLASQVALEMSDPLPWLGKMMLYDGKTGEPFDRPVTVGVIYLLKLHHLVEDKVHARSTGPYSLVTQQPLGGKAQFGGQRFGEMEVWALEAYGAAHSLQEMLTIKSDDVQGRVRTYEAIIKGEQVQEPGVPASFKVLVKELQSLGLAVEAVTQEGEVLHFGKDEARSRPPRLGMGLLSLSRRV